MKNILPSTCGKLNNPKDMVPLRKLIDMPSSRTTLTSLLNTTNFMTKVFPPSDLDLTNSQTLPTKNSMLVSLPEDPDKSLKTLITSLVKIKSLLILSIGELLVLLTQLETKVTVVHAGPSLLFHHLKAESSRHLASSLNLLNKNLLIVPTMVPILTKDVTVVGKIPVFNTLLTTVSLLLLNIHIPLRMEFARRTFNQDTLLVQSNTQNPRVKLHSFKLLLLSQLLLLLTVVTDSSKHMPVVFSVNNVPPSLTMLSQLLVMVLMELLHSSSSETHGVPHGVNKVTSESRELVMVMVFVVF